ncbi:protein of unknown function [Taphrina deformans PYCC 5710]|uniref:Protection of telomeres protein 1 n=1 Tax=Taphrina deformans (strain PYCC 5710 / ATCC 11124 / CBS 356.35 / IMI 108563 / JCM 9778 / NBRC 8474) TaxID=1097556 RepID=R4XGA7_TAPDE|nr:protein of unknown function [Taphrina deformans PYCC 5710]|eukprot:CCG84790.1 protein of unknown function [Taphrina deformans PYCC 5710]
MATDMITRPIAEHYASLRGFSLISDMGAKGQFVDLIAVVANFTEIKPTRGTDMSRALIVCDPSAALPSTGLLAQFYMPSAADLPRPAEGSVIILKQFKTFEYRGGLQIWSNNNSSWIIMDPNGSIILSKSKKQVIEPTNEVRIYLKRLADWWKTRSGRSANLQVDVPQNVNSISAHSTGRPTITLKEVKEGRFYDVYGYVVKTFPSRENAFTLYVTDYTTNDLLHDYTYGESKWAGPFGQRTMQVTLWDAHAHYARAHVHENHYVYLRNLQGKRGDSGRLEGAVRGDRANPSKVNVILIQPDDPRVKSIKLRRAQYESTWRLQKEKLEEEYLINASADRLLQLTPPTSVNPNLDTSYSQVPLTTVGDILEPPYIPQAERVEGPGGRKRPHKYRTVGRIIDFWPSDLRDFSRPYCMSCQATYVPAQMPTIVQSPDQYREQCTLCNAPRDDDDPDTYEISFTLLIEGQDSVCMPIIFSGEDVETLLGSEIVPCNLHLPENSMMLNRLRERLFLLWGNLEESFNAPLIKKQKNNAGTSMNHQPQSLMWNEICVMEYWLNEAAGQAGWGGRRFKGFGMALT